MDKMDLYLEAKEIIERIEVGVLGDSSEITKLLTIVEKFYDKCNELEDEVKLWKGNCGEDENECIENCLCCPAYDMDANTCDLGYPQDFIYED